MSVDESESAMFQVNAVVSGAGPDVRLAENELITGVPSKGGGGVHAAITRARASDTEAHAIFPNAPAVRRVVIGHLPVGTGSTLIRGPNHVDRAARTGSRCVLPSRPTGPSLDGEPCRVAPGPERRHGSMAGFRQPRPRMDRSPRRRGSSPGNGRPCSTIRPPSRIWSPRRSPRTRRSSGSMRGAATPCAR